MLDQLIEYLEKNDKESAFKLCYEALDKHEITIPELYENVLAPALNRIVVTDANDAEMIWREHAMSGIVRSIIEAAYPFVMAERQAAGRPREIRVLVFCPEEETHEIGARMVADFFLIAGCQVTFIGANTPEKTVMTAIERIQPHYLSISVSNYYNLFVTKKLIGRIRDQYGSRLKILVGGRAFASHPESAAEVGADQMLADFADIGRLLESGADQR